MLISIDTITQFNKIIKNNKVVVVDFHREQCGPCKLLKPYLDYCAKTYTDITFCDVDTDIATDSDDLVTVCNIKGVPAVLVFVDGNHDKNFSFYGFKQPALFKICKTFSTIYQQQQILQNASSITKTDIDKTDN